MSDRKTEESIDDFRWTNRISLGLLVLGFTLLITFIVLIAAFHISLPILGLVGVCMGFAGGITQHIMMISRHRPVGTSENVDAVEITPYARAMAYAGMSWPLDLSLMTDRRQCANDHHRPFDAECRL